MADPTTVNTSMSVPIRGTDIGTWDVPVNGNFSSLDAMMGGVTTVALTSSPVTLLSSQALVNVIRLTGTLTSSTVTVTLPGIYKSWTLDNQIVNSPSSFAVTLISTSGTSIIGCPPGTQDVFYDGSTVNYRNLGRVGEYWDYAAATVPTWVTASTKPPYLNCNATTFSSATYPILANLLGTVTLPDSRGKSRFALDQGAGLVSSAGSGIAGGTVGATGGSQFVQNHNHLYSDPGHTHAITWGHNGVGQPLIVYTGGGSNGYSPGANFSFNLAGDALNSAAAVGITISNSSFGGTGQNMPPAYMGGITMIRAA